MHALQHPMTSGEHKNYDDEHILKSNQTPDTQPIHTQTADTQTPDRPGLRRLESRHPESGQPDTKYLHEAKHPDFRPKAPVINLHDQKKCTAHPLYAIYLPGFTMF